MDDNQKGDAVTTLDNSWMGDGPEGTTEIPFSSVGRSEDWEVMLPSVS